MLFLCIANLLYAQTGGYIISFVKNCLSFIDYTGKKRAKGGRKTFIHVTKINHFRSFSLYARSDVVSDPDVVPLSAVYVHGLSIREGVRFSDRVRNSGSPHGNWF